jgi:hypothetical protein
VLVLRALSDLKCMFKHSCMYAGISERRRLNVLPRQSYVLAAQLSAII